MVRKIKFKKLSEINKKNEISLDIFPVRDYNFLEKNTIRPMIGTTFKAEGLIGIKKEISEEVIYKIPIIKIIIEFLELLEEEEKIKLTKTGNLPPRFVKTIYKNSLIKDYFIEENLRTLRTENDIDIIKTARILCELVRYSKKQKGEISLTVLGKKMLKNKYKLLENIIEIYVNKFNWGYFEPSGKNYHFDEILSYILYLLDRGIKYDDESFTEELIKAFPRLLENLEEEDFELFTNENKLSNAFNRQCLGGFLNFMGLVELKEVFLKTVFVKSDIFDEIISFERLNFIRKENKKEREKINADKIILYFGEHNALEVETKIDYDVVENWKKKKKDRIDIQVYPMSEKLSFACTNCGTVFDYDVEEIIMDSKIEEAKFKKTPICPHCKTKNENAVLVNEKGGVDNINRIIMKSLLNMSN